MQQSSPEAELQQQSEVADAALGVAEDLGLVIAALAGLAAQLQWDTWLVTVPIAITAYIISTYSYRKRAATAEDNYHRVVGLGKYANTQKNNAV